MQEAMFIKPLAKAFKDKGGGLYLVGGRVRDFFLQASAVKSEADTADYDLMASALTIEQVMDCLLPFGTPKTISRRTTAARDKQESIVHFLYNGFLLEISPARMWQGTDVVFCPKATLGDDAAARDFTINAIYYDPLTGLFHDPLGGIGDIASKYLSLASDNAFLNDPLRIMRAFSFISRFALTADGKLLSRAKDHMHLMADIPPDRLWPQWGQWAMGTAPHLALLFLERAGLLDFWPMLAALKKTPQSRFYHPEGDVWRHSVLTVEHMAYLDVPQSSRTALMLAALLHDLGKPATTMVEGKRVSSPGHAQAGAIMAAEFLSKYVKAPHNLMKHVCKLIDKHMNLCPLDKASPKSLRRLNRRLAPESNLAEFWALATSDHNGRGPDVKAFTLSLDDFLAPLDGLATVPPPLIQGRDLLAEFDLKPGPVIGSILKAIEKAADEGLLNNRQDALNYAARLIASGMN